MRKFKIYTCDGCGYIFDDSRIPDSCPACESVLVRKATVDEMEEFFEQAIKDGDDPYILRVFT